MNDEQLERYARHIVLREIGGKGQQKLCAAHAVIIGAGGIGSPVIQYLAAAGVGRLTIVDDDRVALSNLQRQTLFTSRDVGAFKVEKAAAFALALNPDATVDALAVRLDADNAAQLLAGADIIIDGSDNFATRLTVADASTRLAIPLVSAAVSEFDGQLGVWRGWEKGKPCYRCFAGSDPARPEISCSDLGILGAMAGVMGSFAALEATRIITGFGEDSAGKLLLVDARTLRLRLLAVPKDPGCPICLD